MSHRALFVFCAALTALTSSSGLAQAPPNKACALVTASELQAAFGSAVTLKPGTLGNVQTCGGQTPTASVLIRYFSRAGDKSGLTEQAAIEALKKAGAQVDVKSSGGITCLTMVPPPQSAAMGFGTSCTVTSKAPLFAVIEVTAQSQKDMLSIEKLRPVAEKMATRF